MSANWPVITMLSEADIVIVPRTTASEPAAMPVPAAPVPSVIASTISVLRPSIVVKLRVVPLTDAETPVCDE